MPLQPGTKLGPYEIVAPLDAGNGSESYKGSDTRSNTEVAIKLVAGPPSERFEQEARAVALLNHPHICAIQDIGHEEDVNFLVSEYLEGQTLAAWLEGGKA